MKPGEVSKRGQGANEQGQGEECGSCFQGSKKARLNGSGAIALD